MFTLPRTESPMNFVILRTQKLKSKGAICRSTKHAFREQDTPNADPKLTPENTHIGAQSSDEAMAAVNARLPDKIRKNGVMAIEYLITASPEAMTAKSRKDQDNYFHDSLAWLKAKHGAENVVYVGIHRDEKTPHMYAYVVPIDPKGKLNARHFLGGAKALNAMQTDFAQQVGVKHDFQRGIEGSKATHQRVQSFYGQINQPQAPLTVDKERKVLKKGVFSTTVESDEEYQARIIREVNKQIQPSVEKARLSASETRRRHEVSKTLGNVCEDLKKAQNSIQVLSRHFDGLDKNQIAEVIKLTESLKHHNQTHGAICSRSNKNKGYSR